MPEIPKAVCGQCMVPMLPKKNDVTLQALNNGKPYYKACCDKWECPECHATIYTDFGRKPVAVKHDADYYHVGFAESFELGD